MAFVLKRDFPLHFGCHYRLGSIEVDCFASYVCVSPLGSILLLHQMRSTHGDRAKLRFNALSLFHQISFEDTNTNE